MVWLTRTANDLLAKAYVWWLPVCCAATIRWYSSHGSRGAASKECKELLVASALPMVPAPVVETVSMESVVLLSMVALAVARCLSSYKTLPNVRLKAVAVTVMVVDPYLHGRGVMIN